MATVPFNPLLHTHDSNLELFRCLSKGTEKRSRLPPELIFQIIALPSRWLLLSSHSLSAPTSISSREGERVVVRTPLLRAGHISLIRKIVFKFTSKDQGWSSFPEDLGTFRNSWTWFEVGIIHNDQKKSIDQGGEAKLSERVYFSQRNKHAWEELESYCIEFEAGHQMFADLQEGDAVVLWAKASFPGWTNIVQEVSHLRIHLLSQLLCLQGNSTDSRGKNVEQAILT